jgi:ubiquinone/menaquinone biosynthesis C-methylase UbiE
MPEVNFDGICECYDASRDVPAEVIQQLIDRLNELGILRENRLMVDVACGTARYFKPFASAFTHAIGLDISEEMIHIARQKCENLESVRFIKGDARSMGISGSVADVVVSSKLFIHVREWKSIVAEIKRITKQGGYFIHITETGLFNNNVRKKFRALCRQAKMNFGFLGEKDPEKVGQRFEGTGYRRIHITG